MKDLERVYVAANAIEARFLYGLLEREGIHVQIVGENLVGGYGELPAEAQQPELFAPPEEAGRAREILEDYEEKRAEGYPVTEVPTWTCENCGEQVEAQFEVCWNCESVRPEPPVA